MSTCDINTGLHTVCASMVTGERRWTLNALKSDDWFWLTLCFILWIPSSSERTQGWVQIWHFKKKINFFGLFLSSTDTEKTDRKAEGNMRQRAAGWTRTRAGCSQSCGIWSPAHPNMALFNSNMTVLENDWRSHSLKVSLAYVANRRPFICWHEPPKFTQNALYYSDRWLTLTLAAAQIPDLWHVISAALMKTRLKKWLKSTVSVCYMGL